MRLEELREQVHRGLTGQAMKNFWCGGRLHCYSRKPILDPSNKDAYGNPARVGAVLGIDEAQAKIVAEIFDGYARGISYFTIARTLNKRGVPSPGSAWKREVRRCRGWVASAIRVMLRNPLYTGHVRWNVSQFVRDPDSGKCKRRRRSEAEWASHHDDSLRIVPDAIFEQVQARMRAHTNHDQRLKTGGKIKYLLSGLMYCEMCGANYVLGDRSKHVRSSYLHGRACTNDVRLRRDTVEAMVLAPIRDQLREPCRVQAMVAELHRHLMQLFKENAARSAEAPRELQELNARLVRLRARLREGDPYIAPDELQAAIDRAEIKRRQLLVGVHDGTEVAQMLSTVPRTADSWRRGSRWACKGISKHVRRRGRFCTL